MSGERIIRVMFLKANGYGKSLATGLNGYVENMVFQGTSDEQEAVDALKSGEVDIIILGLLGINWEYVVGEVGERNLIILSALIDEKLIKQVQREGVTFFRIGEDVDVFFQTIREKASQQQD